MKATIKKTGKQIDVYKSKLRNTFINSEDCTTEYKPSELNLIS